MPLIETNLSLKHTREVQHDAAQRSKTLGNSHCSSVLQWQSESLSGLEGNLLVITTALVYIDWLKPCSVFAAQQNIPPEITLLGCVALSCVSLRCSNVLSPFR